MVLVFSLCAIVILITLLICMTLLSTVRIKIENFAMSNIKDKKDSISEKYKITISFYLWNIMKWISFKINHKKIRKIYQKIQLEKFDFKKIEKNFQLKDLKEIRKLNPEVSYFNLELKAGTEDAVLTSFIIFAISTFISILLPHVIKKYDADKYRYEIVPLYINQNVYEMKLNCIIQIKMVHIINIIYVFLKKRRVDSYEQRASNRRTYGYSHE